MHTTDYACAILVRDGFMLLGRRSPHRRSYANCWDVIGGKVEQGELIERTLVRELTEEVGIVPQVVTPFETLVDDNGRGPARYHIFVVHMWSGGEPSLANHEHTELRWFTSSEARDLPDLALPEYPAMIDRLAAFLATRAPRA